MKRLLRYLADYKKESILGPLFKMLEASFELFVPLVVASMIDVGIQNRDIGYILRMGGLLILLGIIGLTCSLTAQYFAAKAAVEASASLRNDLLAHIFRLSYSEIDTVGSSTLITRMTSDLNQVQTGINMVLRLFLRSPFVVFGAMIMAFTVNVQAALVFAVVIPLLSVVVFGILLISMPLYKKVQKQLDRVMLTTRENLLGVRVIRAFNRQKSETARFEEENSILVKFQVFVGKISALLNPVTYIMINLATVAVIWVGALQVDAGVITQGKVVALVNYMSQILVELIKLANLIIIISKSVACMNRIDSVFAMEPGIIDKTSSLEGKEPAAKAGEEEKRGQRGMSVEFKDVSFVYAGAKEPSLSGLSFKAEKGKTIGIIGGTGSGKSTLINLIGRFYDVSSGQVLLNGQDVREFPLHQLRESIGLVPQKAVLFKGTLRENMRWGKADAQDEEIYQALEIAQAKEFVDGKGQGLELEIEQGGRNLSGGQRQRLTIARALVRKPDILILDDSASALDFATDAKLRKAIKEGTGDATVFLVSQRASAVKNADQILVLDDGEIVGKGTHKELLKGCALYREICLSQLTREEVERDAR
ncbi:MAG TPA: ABC transporter ATP-binding protein [Candidatus Cottocaccamicrobium excrementipullorum]|nr:ABC transporter ATP-binding protein [Candidatus Cottocaccamicrobium excrementipullorum]